METFAVYVVTVGGKQVGWAYRKESRAIREAQALGDDAEVTAVKFDGISNLLQEVWPVKRGAVHHLASDPGWNINEVAEGD